MSTSSSVFTRRHWLQVSSAACLSGWLAPLALQAANDPQRSRSCILLWMNGGPATIDLWDLKPGHDHGGPFREIATVTPGIRISQHLPRLSRWIHRMAILRSMSTPERDHTRASYLLRVGYLPQGAIRFPAFGAAVAKELASADAELPPYVSIAPPGNATTILGGGFLGPRFNPLVLGAHPDAPLDQALQVPNLQPPPGVSSADLQQRFALLRNSNQQFLRTHPNAVSESRNTAFTSAERLMRDSVASAFDLSQESEQQRSSYGRNLFGQGCLLARRLIQRGVPFVEVTLDGWDTHTDNFPQVRELSSILDTGWAALLQDLQERGLLDSTLVVCMGEFGRTPRINSNRGRDHWPDAYSTVLSGGGIRGGQVVGRTSTDGTTVEQGPISAEDLLATICHALGIDHTQLNQSNVNRPIRIVDISAQVVEGVVG